MENFDYIFYLFLIKYKILWKIKLIWLIGTISVNPQNTRMIKCQKKKKKKKKKSFAFKLYEILQFLSFNYI